MRGQVQRLTEVNGRYLTILETERLLAERLTQQKRLAVSDWLHAAESTVATWATEQFQQTYPHFDAPPGSERFEKGVRDGRYILRYLAQSVREGTSEPIHHNVLSWYVGHLDPRSVCPRDIERFICLLQTVLRQQLASPALAWCELTLDEAIAHCRNAAPSGLLKRGQNAIAAQAMDWLMMALPELGKHYGAATRIKGTRDFCFLIEELGRLFHSPNQQHIYESCVCWLVERLMPFVSYPAKVWRWSFLALIDGVVHHLPAVEALRTARVLGRLAAAAERLVACNYLFDQAEWWSELLIAELAGQFGRCGLADPTDFDKRIATACRHVVETLAVQWVCVDMQLAGPRIATLWIDQILPMLPDQSVELSQAFLNELRQLLERDLTDPLAREILKSFDLLQEIAGRTLQGQRLASVADQLTSDTVQTCLSRTQVLMNANVARQLHDDLRLLLAHCALVLPVAPTGIQVEQLRAWLVDEFLPTQSLYPHDAFASAVQTLLRALPMHLSQTDVQAVNALLETTLSCIHDYQTAQTLLTNLNPLDASWNRRLLRTLAINTNQALLELTDWLQQEVLATEPSEQANLPDWLEQMSVLATGQQTDVESPKSINLPLLFVKLRQVSINTIAALQLMHHAHTLAETATRNAWRLSQSGRGRKSTHAVEPFVQDVTCMLRQIALELLERDPSPWQVQHWVRQYLSERISIWPLHLLRYLREQLPPCVEQAVGSRGYEATAPLLNWALN